VDYATRLQKYHECHRGLSGTSAKEMTDLHRMLPLGLLFLAATSHAQQSVGSARTGTAMEAPPVIVTGNPLGSDLVDLASPADVLSGPTLRARLDSTLGETLSSQTGVSSSYFGPNSSRPVIRGLLSKTLVRKAGGIGEAIKEAAARCRKESEDREAQFKAKRDAEIAAERAQCGLSNPVNVFVHSYDGYPMHIKHGGKELKPRDWSVIKGNQFSFIESAVLAELIEAHDAAEAAKRQAVADRDAAAKSAFQSRLVEAQTLGKPVALESWMTDRCMKRHRDCSFDSATRWVNPDGTEKVTYTCCY